MYNPVKLHSFYDSRILVADFGSTLYLKQRGACTCQTGEFICELSEEGLDHLGSGKSNCLSICLYSMRTVYSTVYVSGHIYLAVGFSRDEGKWLRSRVPENRREAAGFDPSIDKLALDIGRRLQSALIRILPPVGFIKYETSCQ